MTKETRGNQIDGSIAVKSRLRPRPQPDSALDAQHLGHALDFGASFFISGILAVSFRTMTAPLERVKLILQSQASTRDTSRTAYKGIIDAFTRIPREQGFFSLWRGNFTNICRYFPAQAINFSFYDLYYEAFEKVIQPSPHSHDILPFLAGGAVGFTSCSLLYPLTFCNTRLAVDLGDSEVVKREFYGLRDCLQKVYKADGLRGFYQGMTYASTGLSIYRSIYFGVYTYGKRHYMRISGQDHHTVSAPFIVSLGLAIAGSIIATYASYPLDTLSRQKMLYSGRGVQHHESARNVIATIINQNGMVGFYKGVHANILTTLCGSLLLATYDVIRGRFDKIIDNKDPKSNTSN